MYFIFFYRNITSVFKDKSMRGKHITTFFVICMVLISSEARLCVVKDVNYCVDNPNMKRRGGKTCSEIKPGNLCRGLGLYCGCHPPHPDKEKYTPLYWTMVNWYYLDYAKKTLLPEQKS